MSWFFKSKNFDLKKESIEELDKNSKYLALDKSDDVDNDESDDGDQRFIKKDSVIEEISEELEEIVEEFKENHDIRPEGFQQRNLDREMGGLETEEQKESSKKDIWDDRSEEVDRMGSHNPLGSSAKKSMLWNLIKKKLYAKKHNRSAEASEVHAKSKIAAHGYDSRQNQVGYVKKIRSFRQDHINEHGNDKGAWR